MSMTKNKMAFKRPLSEAICLSFGISKKNCIIGHFRPQKVDSIINF